MAAGEEEGDSGQGIKQVDFKWLFFPIYLAKIASKGMLNAMLSTTSPIANPVFTPSNFLIPMTAKTIPQNATSGWVNSASQ